MSIIEHTVGSSNAIVTGPSRRRMLVAYSNASNFTTTTGEYLKSFERHASWEVDYLHVTHGARPDIDLSGYDAVLISYCARLCFPGYVSEHFLRLLDTYRGVRAVAIQDEYEFVEIERKALDRIRPHVIFTCIPLDQREWVYPASRYPNTKFVQVLTGYVADGVWERSASAPIASRPVHIGYRGRDLGPRYGKLGHMKHRIGEVFRREAEQRAIPADIAMDEHSRIYGDQWYHWLGKCRCVLGSESGSNIFDFDGSISAACRRGVMPDATVRRRIAELDRRFDMGQISARVFEAAAMRTALLLYEGRYSDALEPHEHFIPVAHDHSNLDQVFAAIGDVTGLEAMVARAHAHLIGSGRFGYPTFVRLVEQTLSEFVVPRPVTVCPSSAPLETDIRSDPSIERPTRSPQAYDTFQLRQVVMQLRNPLMIPKLLARHLLLDRFRESRAHVRRVIGRR